MKVLWFTGIASKKNNSYGGGGWIRSLATELSKHTEITLATAYFYDEDITSFTKNGYTFIPMYRKKRNKVQKILYNWFQTYRKRKDAQNLSYLKKVISDFQPDIIQVFGTESVFTDLLGNCNIPIILYLQGMINPIHNSFYPYLMNDNTVKRLKADKSEWLLNNGIVRRHNDLKAMAEKEKKVLERARYIIGRTTFDYRVSRLYSSSSKYFKLNEMMRENFYNSQKWQKKDRQEYIIFSTLSGVTYKGFDVILKTAHILKSSGLRYKWMIAGLDNRHRIISFFERFTNLISDDLNICYLGVLQEDQLINRLLESDVMVHPSYIDNSPNSVCEAQLLGLPIVACYVGGVPDLITNNETGLLIPANDPYQLAYILKEDMANPYLHRFSIPAMKKAIVRHDRQSIVNDVINIYNEILLSK